MYTTKVVDAINQTFIKFTSNQCLVISNFKRLHSSPILINFIISVSCHFHKSFLARVKVDLYDFVFSIVNDYFYHGNLFGLVKTVTINEVKECSSTAKLTIWKGESKCVSIMTLNLSDFQASKLFYTFFAERLQVWN